MSSFKKFKTLVNRAASTGGKQYKEKAYEFFVDHIDENDLDAYIAYLNEHGSDEAQAIAALCQAFAERYENEKEDEDEFLDTFEPDDDDDDDDEDDEDEDEEDEEEEASEYYERLAQNEIFKTKLPGRDRLGYKTGVGSITLKIAKERLNHCKALRKAIKAGDKLKTKKLLVNGSTAGIFSSKYRRERAIKILNHRVSQWQRKVDEIA